MKDTVRVLRYVVVLGFRVDPLRVGGGLVLASLAYFAAPFGALGLKMLTNGISGADNSQVFTAVALLGGSIILGLLLASTVDALSMQAAEKTTHALAQRIAILAASIPTLEHFERPDYADRVELARSRRALVAYALPSLGVGVAMGLQIALVIGLLGLTHPLLMLLPLFGVPGILASSRIQRRERALDLAQAERTRVYQHLFDVAVTPVGAAEARVFGLSETLLGRRRAIWRELDRERVGMLLPHQFVSFLGSILLAGGFALAVVFVIDRALRGESTPGDVVMTVSLAAAMRSQMLAANASMATLRSSLDAGRHYLWLEDYASARQKHRLFLPLPQRLAKGIDLERVSFTYPGTEREVLRDITLKITAGSSVAIVGENGAGKTTLVKLLCALYSPSEGRILIDGNDLRDVDFEEWRRRVSTAFQDFTRFEFVASETVGVGDLPSIENIPAVVSALKRAGAADVPEKLPSGLKTPLGRSWEGGHELSEGQWQKLALGRAMMRERPLLLILDEPTASLDAPTEYALFGRYSEEAKRVAESVGSITVLVSHRFSTVRMADQIVVMSKGAIIEKGSHDDLIDAGGTYAELFGIQARQYS